MLVFFFFFFFEKDLPLLFEYGMMGLLTPLLACSSSSSSTESAPYMIQLIIECRHGYRLLGGVLALWCLYSRLFRCREVFDVYLDYDFFILGFS